MTDAAACMHLEDILLSDISQSQNDKCCMTPLMPDAQSSQIWQDKVERWLLRAGGESGMGRGKCLIGTEFQLGEDTKVLAMDGEGGYTTM